MVSRNPAHKLDDNEGLGDIVDDNDHQDHGKSPANLFVMELNQKIIAANQPSNMFS